MTKEDKIKAILDKRGYYNLDLVAEIEQVYKEELAEQLILPNVVRSLLNKEAKDIGFNVEDLYLSVCKNEVYLETENLDDYYFSLREVKVFK